MGKIIKMKLLVVMTLALLLHINVVCAQSSSQLDQITISPGGISKNNLNASMGQIVNMTSTNKIHTTATEGNKAVSAHMQFFPNPASDNINIQNDDVSLVSFSIQVYDMQGHLVLVAFNTGEKITTLSILNLKPGSYIAAIYSSNNLPIENYKFTKI